MGQKIEFSGGLFHIPDQPIVPYIEGDGIGKDITPPVLRVIDEAVKKAYQGKRRIDWKEIYAGEKAFQLHGDHLPPETPELIREYRMAIKGPLTTPIGGGFRSINVTLRQMLDLYACVWPVNYIRGAPSPMKSPERYHHLSGKYGRCLCRCGIRGRFTRSRTLDFGLGGNRKKRSPRVRPSASSRCPAIEVKGYPPGHPYAIDHGKKSVTLVHKGNIMKYTEGFFKKWGYELAVRKFRDQVITEDEVNGCAAADQRVVIKDRIADSMFQQLMLRPEEYEVLATPNLNGDYLSDAAAAQVGGLGMAPGPTSATASPCLNPPTGALPNMPARTRPTPVPSCFPVS